ncbi:hypothetical protein C8R47DRAFT_594135 [Mycena vitilis]|nr:hypothetical protein C8R47DRAFT_594135 [Mycena vitilis]
MDLPSANSVSELAVERVVGSALSGIFYSAKKVHVLSGQKCALPASLRPTRRFAYPDLAAVRTGNTGDIEPVVIIGEGKVRARGLKDDAAAQQVKQPNPRAQMAAAVHSTLILLVLCHYERTPGISIQELATTDKDPGFDEKTAVYGIYYDEKSIHIYLHFPQVQTVGAKNVIRFNQIPVAEYSFASSSFVKRWYCAASLFCIQKHANLISGELTTIIHKYKD